MMMTNKPVQIDLDAASLDALFATARDAEPVVSDAFLARVLADADTHQPRAAVPPKPVRSRGFWAQIGGLLGGALPVTGLLTAGLVGLYSGFALPVDFDFDLGLLASAQTLDFYPTDFETWTEVLEIDPAQQDQ